MKILVLHETDGRPYYRALELFARSRGAKVVYKESSVFRILLKAILTRKGVGNALMRLPCNFWFRISQFWSFWDLVVYASAPFDFRIVFYWPTIRFRTKAVIYHTSWPYWENGNVPRMPVFGGCYIRQLYKSLILLPNCRVYAVLPTVLDSVTRFVGEPVLGRSIPHCVDFDLGTPRSVKESGRLKVGFVGKLIPEKGIATILQLAKLLGGKFDFIVIGDGPLANIVSSSHERRDVDWLGALSREQIPRAFDQIDILLVPSERTAKWEELFGIVIIEALARGVVVVASDHVGPRAIIKDGVNGYLVRERDLALIQNVLCRLGEDRERLSTVSKEACASAERYKIEQVAKEWEDAMRVDFELV